MCLNLHEWADVGTVVSGFAGGLALIIAVRTMKLQTEAFKAQTIKDLEPDLVTLVERVRVMQGDIPNEIIERFAYLNQAGIPLKRMEAVAIIHVLKIAGMVGAKQVSGKIQKAVAHYLKANKLKELT
jgi:hypothetical protein